MLELMNGWAYLIGSWANFFFTLEFNDGVSYGGFLLAVGVLGVLIDYIFSHIRRERPNVSVKEVKQLNKTNNSKG